MGYCDPVDEVGDVDRYAGCRSSCSVSRTLQLLSREGLCRSKMER